MPVKPVTNQRGFTLIEVIIAMAIFAILAAIAVPSFNVWRQNAQFRSDARLVMGALQQARVDAITRNESITVTFTSTDWTVDGEDPNKNPLRSGDIELGTLGGDSDVTFDSRGMPGSAASFTVTVAGKSPLVIEVSAAGNISLQ